MSFNAIPSAVLVHCLAPFFVFDPSVDPARSQQCTNGAVLLLLRKFTPVETAQIKREMTRVTVHRADPNFQVEVSKAHRHVVLRKQSDGTWARDWMNVFIHCRVEWDGTQWLAIVQRPMNYGKTI